MTTVVPVAISPLRQSVGQGRFFSPPQQSSFRPVKPSPARPRMCTTVTARSGAMKDPASAYRSLRPRRSTAPAAKANRVLM